MTRALTEAETAADQGEVPVGAVVLDPDGTVIGVGRNDREDTHDPTGHAEVVALRAAARARDDWRLTGCTLAVTLEPCAMCAGALVLARIETLVYGARDPKAGAAGSLWDIVRDPRLNHQLEVIPPDLISPDTAERCSRLLFSFFSARRLR
ncbi:tRNA adenosine(34) deaminase TadA [Spiractinospora alimapuensis]|uniref:tRNA adenosine(34) deaminase TadA n=1 Tax=Spiractinospora alimapuensis TaxID=2820884 RepID=UPI001EEBBEA9|nr:tRNA adenosine(34) deaminase TadA [Spiractinospora alimapuensis]QVQ54971.1 tRNA adenosine(34) deaminase TadA [Spiractinospora alimapuensis]